MKTVPNTALDERQVKEDEEKLKEYYQKEGFNQVSVSHTIARERATGLATVTFRIREGRKVKIREIRFVGNAHIKAKVLMCCGTEDPFATREQRGAFEEEMCAAEVSDWGFELYGGVGHSFTNPAADMVGMPGIAYNAMAERRSWRSMLTLFDETLGPV